MSTISRCGYVAIIGRPNVGKSTLLNALIEHKISITSDKPQTTRFQILGIKTAGENQAIFIDTPGIHTTMKSALNRYMNRMATSVIADADVVMFMIDATRWQEEDEMILERLKGRETPVIIVANKVDKIKDKTLLLPLLEKLQTKLPDAQVIPVSAMKNVNVHELEKMIFDLLPEGPHLFPDDQITDKNDYFLVAEIIREKLIRTTGQEVPYSTAVSIESIEDEEKLVRINAIIWVEREGQKAIIIGDKGERLKQIGTQARKDIEALLDKKVFLRLWVKVKDRWTDDERVLRSLGYG